MTLLDCFLLAFPYLLLWVLKSRFYNALTTRIAHWMIRHEKFFIGKIK